MKKLLLILMLLPFIGIAQNNEKQIMTMTGFMVKDGHSAQFEDGVKKWKECYVSNDGEGEWNMWKRVQGTGIMYGATSFMDKWAEMDEKDSAGKNCSAVFMNFIMPHVEKIKYDLSETIPDWNRKSERIQQPKLAWVTYYDVKKDGAFNEIISEVIETMKATEGDSRAYWYNILGGGKEASDYMVSTIYNSYADLDVKRDSPYEMYVKAKGEKKAKELSEKWYTAVSDSWSYIWEFLPELSN